MQKNADTVADTNPDTVQGLDWLDTENSIRDKMRAKQRRNPLAIIFNPKHTGRPVTRPQPSIEHPSHGRPALPHGRPSRPMSTGLA